MAQLAFISQHLRQGTSEDLVLTGTASAPSRVFPLSFNFHINSIVLPVCLQYASTIFLYLCMGTTYSLKGGIMLMVEGFCQLLYFPLSPAKTFSN